MRCTHRPLKKLLAYIYNYFIYMKIILNSAVSHLRLLLDKPSGNHPSLPVNVSGTPLIKGSSSIVLLPRKFGLIQHNHIIKQAYVYAHLRVRASVT